MKPQRLFITQELATRFHKFQDLWANCDKCDLCTIRHKLVHFRGNTPCDALFIGEAPGESENILGYPFVGPAGTLLETLISTTRQTLRVQKHLKAAGFTYGIINIVACYPGKNDFGDFNRPHKNAVKQCEPHLRQLLEFCRPRILITLGEFADKKLPRDLRVGYKLCHLAHPSSILRMKDPNMETLAKKKFTTTLSLCLAEALQ